MKWYVFDEADCFGGYDDILSAAKQAAWLVDADFGGVEIKYLSEVQFKNYCQTGILDLTI